MKFGNQDISKTITAMSFKLGQLIVDKIIKKKSFYFLPYRKLDMSKIVTARSFKLGHFIEDNEKTTW